MIVNHLWLADWCRQWLNVNPVRRRFVETSFFLLLYMCTVSHSVGFSLWTLYHFVSKQKWCWGHWMMFFSSCSEWLSLAWQSASLSSGSLRFLSTIISQGSVATHLRSGQIFNYWLIRFWKSKIGQHLAKLQAKVEWDLWHCVVAFCQLFHKECHVTLLPSNLQDANKYSKTIL